MISGVLRRCWPILLLAAMSCGEGGGSRTSSAALDDYLPGPAAMRRLTSGQYVATMHSLFGEDIEVFPPTEVDARVEGLLSLGANEATVTPAGLERYESTARQVAAQVLAPDRRSRVLGCSPRAGGAPDDACATEFVMGLAPLVLRRELRTDELAEYVSLARASSEELGDFYLGLESILSSWLLSADFLFIQEPTLAPESDAFVGEKLSAEALASRLSYFLWNRGPDRALLDAAASGDLDTEEGYAASVARLIADEAQLERGIRALFSDLYELDALDRAAKDTASFPQYTMGVIEDAKEQTLRTIVDHLLTRRGDYRDLFTTRNTFMTKNLGPLYGARVTEDWEPYEFPADGVRAGILSHVSFLALHARSARSSPVLRGEFILDSLLCTPIPPPPADVNFEALAPENGLGDTARERLAVHRADPNCAVCHDLMDPIGLAFENFDAIGQFRTQENGVTIETYGEIDDVEYADITGFYPTLRNAPRLTECMVTKLFMHAVGRIPSFEENVVLEALQRDFESVEFDFVGLMEAITMTHGFRAASGPRQAENAEASP